MNTTELNHMALAWVKAKKEEHSEWSASPHLRFLEWRNFIDSIKLDATNVSWVAQKNGNARSLLPYIEAPTLRQMLHTIYAFELNWALKQVTPQSKVKTSKDFTNTKFYTTGKLVISFNDIILHEYEDVGDEKNISAEKASVTDLLKRLSLAVGAGSRIYKLASVLDSKSNSYDIENPKLKVLNKFVEQALSDNADKELLAPNSYEFDDLVKKLGFEVKTEVKTEAKPQTQTPAPTKQPVASLPSGERTAVTTEKISLADLVHFSKAQFEKLPIANKNLNPNQIKSSFEKATEKQCAFVHCSGVMYVVSLNGQKDGLVRFCLDSIDYREAVDLAGKAPKVLNL